MLCAPPRTDRTRRVRFPRTDRTRRVRFPRTDPRLCRLQQDGVYGIDSVRHAPQRLPLPPTCRALRQPGRAHSSLHCLFARSTPCEKPNQILIDLGKSMERMLTMVRPRHQRAPCTQRAPAPCRVLRAGHDAIVDISKINNKL